MAAQESGLTSCPAAGIPFNDEIAKVRKAKDDNMTIFSVSLRNSWEPLGAEM